jgi:hypothetical protein
MRDTWIVVNGARVYLDPDGLDRGELHLADPDVMSEQCKGCGEDILQTGSVEQGMLGLHVVCGCGMSYEIERR